MSFSAFEEYGIYSHCPSSDKSVPKQRTTADDWSRLSDEDRRDVKELRCGLGDIMLIRGGLRVSDTALTYVRRHG